VDSALSKLREDKASGPERPRRPHRMSYQMS